MADWRAVAVLPNIYTSDVFDGGEIALTSFADLRVQAIVAQQPQLTEFLSRFTDAFGVKLNPAILIVREEYVRQAAHDQRHSKFPRHPSGLSRALRARTYGRS